jgi:hypothetical protein
MKKDSTSENRQKVHLNIPDDLHKIVKKFAVDEDRDINSAYVVLLRKLLANPDNQKVMDSRLAKL